jgi:hypothetical protein
MVNPAKPVETALQHTVGTWLTKRDYDDLVVLAKDNKVSISAYVRSIIIDVLVETREDGRPDLPVSRVSLSG